MRKELHKPLIWTVIASESSHLLCCVFPTLFSLAGLLSGLGFMVTIPAPMVELHDMIHRWEIPLILMSGVLLALGWAALKYSEKVDCHSTGCAHGTCEPKRSKASLIMMIASGLFVFNVVVYLFVHRTDLVEHLLGHAH